MEKLTIQEEEVMLHIWSMGECFVKDIVAKFPEPKPPYKAQALLHASTAENNLFIFPEFSS